MSEPECDLKRRGLLRGTRMDEERAALELEREVLGGCPFHTESDVVEARRILIERHFLIERVELPIERDVLRSGVRRDRAYRVAELDESAVVHVSRSEDLVFVRDVGPLQENVKAVLHVRDVRADDELAERV